MLTKTELPEKKRYSLAQLAVPLLDKVLPLHGPEPSAPFTPAPLGRGLQRGQYLTPLGHTWMENCEISRQRIFRFSMVGGNYPRAPLNVVHM
jgi:hypothetical protein